MSISILDEFDPLRQRTTSPPPEPLHEAPQKPQHNTDARHQELVQPILDLDSFGHRPKLSRVHASEATVNPNEPPPLRFSTASPSHNLSSRLSASLDDYAPFVSFHHPPSTQPHHAGAATGAAPATAAPPKPPVRPGLASLFKESAWHIADDPIEPPMKIFDGAPGFTTWEPPHRPTPSRTSSHPTHPSSPAPPSPLTLKGFRPDFTPIATNDLAEAIRPYLPPRLRIATHWTLLYSLDLHGVSLATLYDRVKGGMAGGNCGCILVVRDGHGHTFGAFINEPLKKHEGYYGSGECFLWKAEPFGATDFRVGVGVKAFKWTGKNTYMVLCDDSFISFGGGEGKFGLWINADFEKGSSARCLTYGNDVLCPFEPSPLPAASARPQRPDDAHSFEVNRVEVWRV